MIGKQSGSRKVTVALMVRESDSSCLDIFVIPAAFPVLESRVKDKTKLNTAFKAEELLSTLII